MTDDVVTPNMIIEQIKNHIGKNLLESEVPRPNRVFILVDKEVLLKTLHYLIELLRFLHISTITGTDVGTAFEIIYHLSRGRIVVSLKIRINKTTPVIPTITTLIPGASLYEREVHDLLGVVFEGHSNLSPLILPEEWPAGVYPLRKEWTIKNIRTKIDKETEQ